MPPLSRTARALDPETALEMALGRVLGMALETVLGMALENSGHRP